VQACNVLCVPQVKKKNMVAMCVECAVLVGACGCLWVRGGVRAAGVAGGAIGSACCGRGKGGAAAGYTASVCVGRGDAGLVARGRARVQREVCTKGEYHDIWAALLELSYAAGAGAGIGAQRGARHLLPQPLWSSGLMRFSGRWSLGGWWDYKMERDMLQ
jgi:hypothetical protein